MKTPNLRQLRHFVAVAERLHFGRAAAALRSCCTRAGLRVKLRLEPC